MNDTEKEKAFVEMIEANQHLIYKVCYMYSHDKENIDAMYFIGRSYHKLGNKEQALFYYDKLLNEYPDTTRAEQAGQFVNQVR